VAGDDLYIETSPVGPVVRTAQPAETVVLYLRDDWFLPKSSSPIPGTAAQLARDSRATVVCCGYRPSFPGALEDVRAGFDYCESLGRTVVAGERLGAGLAAALLLCLRDEDAAPPHCAVLSSALFDLTLEAPSLSLNAAANPGFDLVGLGRQVRRYAAGAAPTNPLLSPLYGNLHGLPPIQLLAAGNDPLLDDSLGFAARAARSGVTVDLRVRPVGAVPDAGAVAAMTGFIRTHTGVDPSRTDSTSRMISG
jgi:epsilon-lactone hydrolase